MTKEIDKLKQEVEEARIVSYERPDRVHPRNVCYWAEKEGLMIGGMKNKIIKFLENNCVVDLKDGNFQMKPIIGYNQTTYDLRVIDNQESCTCQNNKRYGRRCSHIMAVQAYLFIKRWKK